MAVSTYLLLMCMGFMNVCGAESTDVEKIQLLKRLLKAIDIAESRSAAMVLVNEAGVIGVDPQFDISSNSPDLWCMNASPGCAFSISISDLDTGVTSDTFPYTTYQTSTDMNIDYFGPQEGVLVGSRYAVSTCRLDGSAVIIPDRCTCHLCDTATQSACAQLEDLAQCDGTSSTANIDILAQDNPFIPIGVGGSLGNDIGGSDAIDMAAIPVEMETKITVHIKADGMVPLLDDQSSSLYLTATLHDKKEKGSTLSELVTRRISHTSDALFSFSLEPDVAYSVRVCHTSEQPSVVINNRCACHVCTPRAARSIACELKTGYDPASDLFGLLCRP